MTKSPISWLALFAILLIVRLLAPALAVEPSKRRSPSAEELQRLLPVADDDVLPPRYRGLGARVIEVIGPGGKFRCFERIEWIPEPTRRPELPVRFCLIPDKVNANPCYVMENKVWNSLFGQFEGAHPDHKRDDLWKVKAQEYAGKAGLASADKLPVFNVRHERARDFANWLDGELPSREQWDLAAGVSNEKKAGGPFQMPADGKALFSIGRPYPWEVDDCPLDVSDLGCRQMAGNGKEWTSSLFITGMDLQLRGRSFTMLKPLAFADFTNLNFGSQDPAKPAPTTSFRVAIKIPWKKEPAP